MDLEFCLTHELANIQYPHKTNERKREQEREKSTQVARKRCGSSGVTLTTDTKNGNL